MKKIFLYYRKRGSVIFVAAGIFVALLVLLGSFMKSTTSRVHVTKKLGDVTHAREFAISLATLSSHYIKNVELKDSSSKLRKALSVPIEEMAKEVSEDFKSKFKSSMSADVNSGSENILTLLEKNSGLNKLNWDISWSVAKEDFSAIELDGKKSYCREKDGVIHIHTKISYILPGTKDPIKEDYSFVSRIRVTANLIPVISKFTLYVNDALNGESETRLNLVHTMASGNLVTGSQYRPWVLNNGKDSDVALSSYEKIVKSPRGLVYIGGGTKDKPVLLGTARGWNTSGRGDYGEDFHFYRNANAAEGYWKTLKILSSNKGILAADIGICDDVSDDNLSAWHEQLGDIGYMARKNSIFRLYGTDQAKSPTLVLGYVNSMFATIRIFKSPEAVNFLTYIGSEREFIKMTGFGRDEEGIGNIISFYEAFSSLSYEEYLTKYSSNIGSVPYGKDYLHILTNNTVANPKSQVTDTKLKSLAGYSRDENDFTSIPTPYDGLINNAKLDEMSSLLDVRKLSIDGSSDDNALKRRLAYFTSFKSGEGDVEAYLLKKGILRNGELDLNGWLYIECPERKTVDIMKCKVISQGGIIVGGGGDINVQGDITCENGAHLNLVSLSGKIVVEKNVKHCDASLIAGGGQVWLEGTPSDSTLKINGNIAMRKINNKDKLKRGCELTYKDELSALPGISESEKDRSEFPVLMFDYKDNPKMFD